MSIKNIFEQTIQRGGFDLARMLGRIDLYNVETKVTGEEREAELDEQFYIDGYNLDVDQLVGSELILNMPIRVLCREDCKGISDRYGTNPGSEEGGEEAALDPRMSVIQDIFKQMKEV